MSEWPIPAVPVNAGMTLVWCLAISFNIPALGSTRASVIARREATKQSPALALQPREIASLRSQ